MRRHERGIVAILAAACLAGCATSALDMAPERPDRPWTPVTTESGEIVAGAPPAPSTADGYVLPANPALGKLPAPTGVDPDKRYSLPELIDLAESNNPATQIAWNDARRAALAAGIAESTFLPTLTAGAIGGYQGSGGRQTVQGAGFSSDPSLNGTVSAVSLQWLLFDFGERAAALDAAKQLAVIANIDFTAAHQQLIHAVAVAFYDHAAADARLATATRSLKNAQEVQAAADARRKHGQGTVIEVAQARQATAEAKLAVVRATGGERDAYLALITAMGISPLTKLQIADISGRTLAPAMTTPIEAFISDALARRPDVQSAYAAKKASLANVEAAQAEFMPKFFLTTAGTYASGNLNLTTLPSIGQQASTVNLNGSHWGSSIFAGVSFPLFDGGLRDAQLSRARAEADSADARLAKVRDDAVQQIVLADNALRTSLASYSASLALNIAAQTTFDAALSAYRQGVGSITALTVAETQLLRAEDAKSDSYSSALSAAATLALATGALGSAPD